MPDSNASPLSVTAALTSFHNRYAGASDEVFGGGALADGRTTYQWLADLAPPGRILDLACGDGPLTLLLQDRDCVALDRNAAELAQARERVPGGTFVEGSAQELPFDDGSFDAVLSHMALMLMEHPERVCAEVARVLRPGGLFAGVVSGSLDRTVPAIAELMPAVWTLLDELGTPVAYPRVPWNAETLGTWLPGWEVQTTPLIADRTVPTEDFPRFVRLCFYGVGLLQGEGRERAEALARHVARSVSVDGQVHWRWTLRGFTARAPVPLGG